MQGRQFYNFPRETFSFLSDLSSNNYRAWFEANKARFRRVVEEPVEDFVSVMAARMTQAFKDVTHLHAKVFRIHRDLRFSKDKTPYKTHIGIRFNEDVSMNCATPFFYVQLEAENVLFVVGQKKFEGESIDRYRTAVMNEQSGRALEVLVRKFRANGADLQGDQWQRVPRGYPADHGRANLLRFKGLYVGQSLPVTNQVHGSGFVGMCLDQFANGKPLYDWLKSL